MRTKTLLLTAVLSAAGAVSSFAQVYSVNAVGYINLNLVAGYNLVANQLNAGSPINNSLENIFANATALAAGDTVFKFNGTSFDSATFISAGTWLYSTTTPFKLNPGEGAFIQTTAAKTVTLVGEVPQGSPITPAVTMPVGYSIVSSQVPQSVALGTIGFPVGAGDTIFFFNTTKQSFDSYISIDASGSNFIASDASLPAQPTPKVGEAFFVQRSAAATWSRTFSVNTP